MHSDIILFEIDLEMSLCKHLQFSWLYLQYKQTNENQTNSYSTLHRETLIFSKHYEITPMQYTEIFFICKKIENFIGKILIFYLILLKT